MPLFVLTLAIDMSTASQLSASSSGPKGPPAPQDLEFEGEHIDADAANVEMPELGGYNPVFNIPCGIMFVA